MIPIHLFYINLKKKNTTLEQVPIEKSKVKHYLVGD